ncbi:DUF2975 domain-containing protein [Bordetella genomosp. 8]|uniref:DUF2975 domain-containing protein n=1 Tax=Bordetella genomosp. 8 TaxID=1416806 RepID=UPI0018DF6ED1|nr:DUF2975 domain-containing protein [Bordetella genomosp. 8]
MTLFNRARGRRSLTSDRLADLSHRMAGLTLVVMAALLALNIVNWIYPPYGPHGYGFSFGMTSRWLSDGSLDLAQFPVWQTIGAMLITSVPLLVLMRGLAHLRALFRDYARGAYFSMRAGRHLAAVGRWIALWVVVQFLTEPVLSIWLTIRAEPGHHIVALSLDASALVALFVAACIAIIGRILQRASEVYRENQQFV